MTKTAALQKFFEGFGLDAYAASSVPSDVILPYLTYELTVGAWGDGDNNILVNLWFYTTSEAIPNAKVQEISDYIGLGGVRVLCDGGALWIKRGRPFSQSLKEDTAPELKRRLINIDVEYDTIN